VEDKKDRTLGMEKYDMREYWSKRSKYSSVDIYQAVCAYGAPSQFNEIMDKIQKLCFYSLLKETPVRDKKVLEI